MKNLFQTIILLCAFIIFSCKKTHDSGNADVLALLQHKWSLVVRHGEALRYVGTANDYYNFSSDNTLDVHVENSADTSYYTLLANGSDIFVYPIVNGVISATPTNLHINSISNTQLVISGGASPSELFTDSLTR